MAFDSSRLRKEEVAHHRDVVCGRHCCCGAARASSSSNEWVAAWRVEAEVQHNPAMGQLEMNWDLEALSGMQLQNRVLGSPQHTACQTWHGVNRRHAADPTSAPHALQLQEASPTFFSVCRIERSAHRDERASVSSLKCTTGTFLLPRSNARQRHLRCQLQLQLQPARPSTPYQIQ